MATEAETVMREGEMMKIPNLLDMTGTEAFAFMDANKEKTKGFMLTKTSESYSVASVDPKLILATTNSGLMKHIQFLIDVYFEKDERLSVIRSWYLQKLKDIEELESNPDGHYPIYGKPVPRGQEPG